MFRGRQECNWSVAELARQVAENVHILQEILPNIKIGDIEPLAHDAAWLAKLEQWQSLFSTYTAQRLALMYLL